MKKILGAMLGMFVVIVFPGASFWALLSHVLGGGVAETYIYPLYGGMIVLSGMIVAAVVVITDEIKSLKEEIKRIRNVNSEKEQ